MHISHRGSSYVRVGALAVTLAVSALLHAATESSAAPADKRHGLVRRDTYGVPHILADTEYAAAFAHGYATAEDHSAKLARLFLRAQGKQASVFGEAYVREDLLIQQLGIWDIASQRFGELPPYIQAVLNGYAEGYSTHLAEHRAAAPAWARPITGVDVLAHCRAVLLIDFALDVGPWRAAPMLDLKGSNMWAIARERSSSGNTLLLANPHLDWNDAHLFHEVHIRVPGKINVSGATLIGFPFITIGFNEHLGWTHTVNDVRADDVYELTLGENPATYIYDGMVLPIRSRTVAISVKTSKGQVVRKYRIRSSHFGPVIRTEKGKAYAFRSPNLGLVNFVTQYNLMAKARSIAEFRTALNMQQLPTFNIGYADRSGNILYLFNGRIPVRAAGLEPGKPVAGDSSATDWQVLRPIASLPQLLNPPDGYIQNTNNAPWYTTASRPIDKARFEDGLGGDGLSLRSQLSLQMLENSGRMSLERMMELKGNEAMPSAVRLKSDLLDLARTEVRNTPDLAGAIDVLENWDNRAAVDSRGGSLWVRWVEDYTTRASQTFKQPWDPARATSTPFGIGDARAALLSLERAIKYTNKDEGGLAARWGDVHRIVRGDRSVPVGGGSDTFRSMWYRSDGGKWVAVGGDSYVLAVEFTPSPTAYSVVAYSQSSDPASPHFNDQLALFAQNRFKRSWFTEADIQQNLERSYRPGSHASATRKRIGSAF